LAWLNIYQNLKQIIQDAIAPEIQSIKGDIKAVDARIASVDARIAGVEARIAAVEARIVDVDRHVGGVETELKAGLRTLEARFEKRFEEQSRRWEIAMELRERLAALEAQVRQR
jgi:chromosome segregation ATPase